MDVDQTLDSITWCEEWPMPAVGEGDGGAEVLALLRQCCDCDVTPLENLEDVSDVIRKSNEFPARFPIDTVRLSQLSRSGRAHLRDNLRGTYPVLHERTLLLMAHFLVHKRKHGSRVEQQLYATMSVPQLIDRLLRRRALVFMKKQDNWVLLSGEKGSGGWESIGTDQERPPLLLASCLSYDELKLSALLSVSGATVCINDGARTNAGVVSTVGVEPHAIIMGVIGPRFQRPGRMDCEDLLVTKEQNTAGRRGSVARLLWEQFYQIPTTEYSELNMEELPVAPRDRRVLLSRYQRLRGGGALHAAALHRRCAVLAEVALLEADARAADAGKPAFLNVIGAGLGVWKISPQQQELFVASVTSRVRALLRGGALQHVADVNFAYIKPSDAVLKMFTKCPKSGDDSQIKHRLFLKHDSHPRGGISVWVWARAPAAALPAALGARLLVLTYAWDSNAHPGNEFSRPRQVALC